MRTWMCLMLVAVSGAVAASRVSFATHEMQAVPVLFQGRVQPMEAFAQSWLEEIYHAPRVAPAHRDKLGVPSGSALELVWKMQLLGHSPWDDAPLFWVGSPKLKSQLKLPRERSHFSYNEIKNFPELKDAVASYEALSLLALPHRNGREWVSIGTLQLHYYDDEFGAYLPLENFTAYSNAEFDQLRNAYQNLHKATTSLYAQQGKIHLLRNDPTKGYQVREAAIHLATLLSTAYGQRAAPELPSSLRLRAELLYSRLPVTQILVGGYGLVALLLTAFYSVGQRRIRQTAYLLAASVLGLHLAALLLRCYILARPPVSNMAETLVYVPFVAVLAALILQWRSERGSLALFAGSVAALCVLVCPTSTALQPVQAVLNSRLWLTVHVLMVVASYGIFLLGGILGHIYLVLALFRRSESRSQVEVSRLTLRALYVGVGLLITGTILGGVWAAQSWGRFWDWDPKESWAFISSCVYLFVIHAHQFRLIGNFGLAVGSVVGLAAITFTWYGVNYILGTGLHSYGFGNGGEVFYYLFLIAEAAFLTAVALFQRRRFQTR